MVTVDFQRFVYDGSDVADSTQRANLRKTVELPFVPTLGVGFFFGIEGVVMPKRVYWLVDENRCICEITDTFVGGARSAKDMKLRLDDLAEQGWSVAGVKEL